MHVCQNVASLLVTNCASITLHYLDVMRQVGPSDCGLFAIAFATALASGNDPGQLFFDQSSMRHHLIQCIEAGCMQQFPVKKTWRRKMVAVRTDFTFSVYCYCRLPKLGNSKMTQCSGCKERYHVDVSVKVNKSALKPSVKWICKNCCC